MDESEITQLNFNFLPRLVLGFEGLTKNADRQSQKYQKFSKLINDKRIDYSYNSVSYDFSTPLCFPPEPRRRLIF